jgi:hypothetical protein
MDASNRATGQCHVISKIPIYEQKNMKQKSIKLWNDPAVSLNPLI